MATRRDTLQRKTNLKNYIRSGWRDGSFRPGDIAPSVRELAEQYNLSRPIVMQVVQELVQEGVLYTVPSVGTYFGQPTVSNSGFYLIVFPYTHKHNRHFEAVCAGFEEAIATKGGASLVLTYDMAREYLQNTEFPKVAGVFEMHEGIDIQPSSVEYLMSSAQNYVRFLPYFGEEVSCDSVTFDDFGGGQQAAQHLLDLGHKKIAYLGLHQNKSRVGFRYSVERERGWKDAMLAAGNSIDYLSFCPSNACTESNVAQIDIAREVALSLAKRPDITAVVTVNENVTEGLFGALQINDIAAEQWPTIVSFDDSHYTDGHVISSMRIPWRELGQQGAKLLWEKNHGRAPIEQQLISLPLQLISRLTSQPSWAKIIDPLKNQDFSVSAVF